MWVFSIIARSVLLWFWRWTKIVEAIGKNQYSRIKENESSLKDVLNLEESHSLDENIRHLCTFLETYLLSLFTIVCDKNWPGSRTQQ